MFDEINGDFIQWIRCFYYIAENRSMTLAARAMNRSQSTLSIQLKKLETLLNVPLFNRTNNTMILTEEGKKLYNKAITLLELVSDIQKLSDISDTEIYGNISIACLNQIATCFLPDYISQFRKKYQKVSFTLNTGMHSMLTHLVSSNEVDFGVLAYNSNYAETLKILSYFFHGNDSCGKKGSCARHILPHHREGIPSPSAARVHGKLPDPQERGQVL